MIKYIRRVSNLIVIISAATYFNSMNVFAMEAKVFAISDFVPAAAGGCNGNDMAFWDNMVDRWYDKMGAKGHIKDGQYTNGFMTIKRFCDPDIITGCNDHNFLDEADAAMIATHGSDSGDHWAGTMRRPWSGHCKLDAGGTATDMAVGDFDLEFIHFSSSYSADDDNLSGIREAMYDVSDTAVNGRRAHQWDGFHGVMWISPSFANDYKNFADDAHSISMSSAWVNNMYDSTVDCNWNDPFNWFGSCQEQCPVAYSISSTIISVVNRLNNERYNNVYSDPNGKNWYAYKYIRKCNPIGETAFNPN
ncbi:DUF6345 domain-containing protein [uncultured Microbulbifer sp.]|uniref:DUF6345 domain-containing protein n=1 Tax=uncultured Microbulbifer sp. TaxID=348147 RepID=UPI00263599D0|nr:DUF6345 domain-containing protein [uncultured Microbulbifer sp.]